MDLFIAADSERRVTMGERIKALETNQSAAAWIATALSGIVAAIVGSVVALVSGRQ